MRITRRELAAMDPETRAKTLDRMAYPLRERRRAFMRGASAGAGWSLLFAAGMVCDVLLPDPWGSIALAVCAWGAGLGIGYRFSRLNAALAGLSGGPWTVRTRGHSYIRNFTFEAPADGQGIRLGLDRTEPPHT